MSLAHAGLLPFWRFYPKCQMSPIRGLMISFHRGRLISITFVRAVARP